MDCQLVVIIICVLFLPMSSKSQQKRKKITKTEFEKSGKSNKNGPRCGYYTKLPGS